MPATIDLAPPSYAAVLAHARIAALNALTDILNTSDDPVERRHAATTILRLPELEPASESPSPAELAPPHGAPPPPRHVAHCQPTPTASEAPEPEAAPCPEPPSELDQSLLVAVLSGQLDIHRSNGLDLVLDEHSGTDPYPIPVSPSAAAGACPLIERSG